MNIPSLLLTIVVLLSCVDRSIALKIVISHSERYSDVAFLFSSGPSQFTANHTTSGKASMTARVYATPQEMANFDPALPLFLSVDGTQLELKKRYADGFKFSGEPPFRRLDPAFTGNFSGRRYEQDVTVMFGGSIATVKLKLSESSVTRTVPTVLPASQLPQFFTAEKDSVSGGGKIIFPIIRSSLPARTIVVRSSALRAEFILPGGSLGVTANGIVVSPESTEGAIVTHWRGPIPLGPGITTITATDFSFDRPAFPVTARVVFDHIGGQYWGTVGELTATMTLATPEAADPMEGFASPSDIPAAGHLSLTLGSNVDRETGVTSAGLYTAQLRILGRRFVFRRGQIGQEITSANAVGGERATLNILTADFSGLSGIVTFRNETYPVNGGRNLNHPTRNPVPFAELFTARLTPPGALGGNFRGHSIASMRVRKGGQVKIIGRMANNETFSAGAMLVDGRTLRFQANLGRDASGGVAGEIEMGMRPPPGLPSSSEPMEIVGEGVVRWPGQPGSHNLEIAGATFRFPQISNPLLPIQNIYLIDHANEDPSFHWESDQSGLVVLGQRLSNAYGFIGEPFSPEGEPDIDIINAQRGGFVPDIQGNVYVPTTNPLVRKTHRFYGIPLQPTGDNPSSPLRVAGFLLTPEGDASDRAEIHVMPRSSP